MLNARCGHRSDSLRGYIHRSHSARLGGNVVGKLVSLEWEAHPGQWYSTNLVHRYGKC